MFATSKTEIVKFNMSSVDLKLTDEAIRIAKQQLQKRQNLY